jgi:hypothetical protein
MDVTDNDAGAFAREFLAALLSWNNAEFCAKLILSHLIGETKVSLAVVAEMGNRGVIDGLTIAALEAGEGEFRDHLTHLCKGFGVILGYRNLYVHNLKLIKVADGEAVGLISQVKGDKRLRVKNQPVRVADLRSFGRATSELSGYAEAVRGLIVQALQPSHDMPATGASSPQKPTWPPQIQSRHDYL